MREAIRSNRFSRSNDLPPDDPAAIVNGVNEIGQRCSDAVRDGTGHGSMILGAPGGARMSVDN